MGMESAYYDSDGSSLYRRPYGEEIVLRSNNGEHINDETCKVLQTQVREHFLEKANPTFKATIKVSKMDPLQKEYTPSDDNAYNRDVTLSYLKVINVPDSSDIDYSASEPNKGLVMDYIDNISYDIEKQEIDNEKEKIKLSKVEKLYQAIKSIHVHLDVAEVSILFGSKSLSITLIR